MDIDLAKKVGPFPLIVWVGVAGIAIYFQFASKRKEGNGTVEGNSGEVWISPATDMGVGKAPQSLWIPNEPPPTDKSSDIRTNDDWAKAAVNYLIKTQGVDGMAAQSAIAKFLEGGNLTVDEKRLVDMAMRQLGALPTLTGATWQTPPKVPAQVSTQAPVQAPSKPPTKTPKPVPKPKPKPKPKPPVKVTPKPRARYYTVRNGDTLSHIALLYYGNANKWPDIYNANRNLIKNPNLIYAGWRLLIP